MSWRARRKVVTFPGGESETPQNVLARTLEKARAGHIKGIIIGIEFDDGSVACDWSNMKQRDFFWLSKNLDYELVKMIEGSTVDFDDWREPGPAS